MNHPFQDSDRMTIASPLAACLILLYREQAGTFKMDLEELFVSVTYALRVFWTPAHHPERLTGFLSLARTITTIIYNAVYR
jgi:hypothetical protein